MFTKLVRRRTVFETLGKTMMYNKTLRFSGSKDEKDTPLCSEPPPPQPPCCPTNGEPPPCPPPPPPCGPPCPPPVCTVEPDPNNPCNYRPPANPDPDEPDMTEIKRLQCLYQKDDGIPQYLKGGPRNVYLFQFITILGGLSFIHILYLLVTLCSK